MTTRSNTASAGNFIPVSIIVSLIVLVTMLFIVIQTENLPLFPASNSAPFGAARAPFFRGLIHIPEFRWVPLFRSTVPDAADEESHMPPAQLIDRWQPFIKEASVRFSIPEKWIRTVIQIESGGRTMLWGRPITSGAGAMGVMQLMRDTYNEMSTRNGLGSDPYNVHDNIIAGTAYLRELYNRYGYPRLFAAYNAGPGVLEAHMQHGAKLPAETKNYIRLALAGTTTVELAAKWMAKISPKPKASSAHSKATAAKASTAKAAKTVANKPAAKPVHVAAVHSASKPVPANHKATSRPVHVATVHSAAKPVRVAVHAPAKTHAPVTHSTHHRAKAA